VADLSTLADGWEIWNKEPQGRIILAYRPDVFNTTDYPAACLPTITIAPGTSPNAPRDHRQASSAWHVALYLEPRVRVTTKDATVPTRPAAIEHALSLSHEFSDGNIDFDAAYIDPRPAYITKLNELTQPSSP
jgi:hypothetical protein